MKPQLLNIAQWLENGCDPKSAAQELRLMANSILDEAQPRQIVGQIEQGPHDEVYFGGLDELERGVETVELAGKALQVMRPKDDAFERGYEDQGKGLDFHDNPFEYSSDEGRRWIDGYVKAMQDGRAEVRRV